MGGESDGPSEHEVELDAEVFSALVGDLESTSSTVMESVDKFADRSVEVIKVDLIIAGAIVSGFRILQESPNIYLYLSVFSFLLSVYFCIQAYSPAIRLMEGVSPGAIDFLRDNPMNVQAYQYNMAELYSKIIRNNRKAASNITGKFNKGLWSSFLGISFFVLSIIKILMPENLLSVNEGILPLGLVIDLVVISIVISFAVLGMKGAQMY